MTYRGSLPHDQGSGFNGQHNMNNQYMQNGFDDGYEAWSSLNSPQLQPQYQSAMFVAPVDYHSNQSNQQSHNHHNHHNHHHNALQRQQQQQRQHMQTQNANYQFQSYNPSFDQIPAGGYQQNNANSSAQMMPSAQAQQPFQQPPNHQPYSQTNDWQHMPPPMPVPSPSFQQSQPLAPSPTPTPTPTQMQMQQQNQIPQRVNSPAMAQSPQYAARELVPNNHNRHASVTTRIDQAANRVSASPRLTSHTVTRSPSVSSTRSPALMPALIPHHHDTNSLLLCVAEDMFAKAKEGCQRVAETLDDQSLHEYQKLVATGLGCYEVALGSNKLAPRLEAIVRLRYANILCDETNNVMEAETALTKGITLCERNRFADLKYGMQFLQVKLLFSQRKGRAAMIAVDARIRDAEVLKHIHWVYAYRFLKSTFYLQSSSPTETHALENLRAITTLASQRGDRTIFVVASLIEGLSHLRVMKEDSIVRIQACIAQAAKYQLEDSVHILQLDVLTLMLDLACSLHQKSSNVIGQKMQALQDRMDASHKDTSWSLTNTDMLLPIRKQPGNAQIISDESGGVLRPGSEYDSNDYLVMSFWNKLEAYTITYTYSSLAFLYQQNRHDPRIFMMWDEALGQLQKTHSHMKGYPHTLEEAIRNEDWRKEAICYLHILRGLHHATSTKWDEVKKCLDQLESMVKPELGSVITLYAMYLSGIYHQGTGDLNTAGVIYRDPAFHLDFDNATQGRRRSAEFDVSLLAAFNLIWIMQEPAHRNDAVTLEMLEQLGPLCIGHPNLEIRTAYNLVIAAVQTNPPIPMTTVKTHLSTALNNAKISGDVQTLSIALNLMRAKLFQSIVGDQALKSAKAASMQAKRSGNTLWMSVADGMLAQSYDVQGQAAEAQKAWQDATNYATQVFQVVKTEDE
ncbi:Uu.00g091900.m01.CDS01 [Anthostomella pinea]|uniref:Uu.00g091900.m01.CDS01 n=1 Tax=Anthostomella pinea TaxID=933095 RepID=A0AAI8VN51_9PEZI|nr:Uu.00g091900.m01.CDS01 [Anthostomella pinea]